MVATAKSKRCQNRIEATLPYSNKLGEILQNLRGAGTVEHALLEDRPSVDRTALVILTANRGLCGGYNTNVLTLAEKWMKEESAVGRPVDVYLSGRKGIGRFRYLKRDSVEQYTNFEDQPTFSEAEELAGKLLQRFVSKDVDRVLIASTRYYSIANQVPEISQLLPIEAPPGESGESGGIATDFIFDPDREGILRTLLPLSVKQTFYRLLLEAAVSEQLARRMAMKLASDNADEMIGLYTRQYNRERQAGITQQIMEIVTGAEALD